MDGYLAFCNSATKWGASPCQAFDVMFQYKKLFHVVCLLDSKFTGHFRVQKPLFAKTGQSHVPNSEGLYKP